MSNVAQTPAVPRRAATVMLLRPHPAGFAVYLTRRSARSRFMPDAFVFPGGAVDREDVGLSAGVAGATLHGGVAPELAVAALRELFEEAGILLARDLRGEPVALGTHELAAIRLELSRGVEFASVLARHELVLDTAAIVYYSNWITPASEPIRFDAHFFLARAPIDQTAIADATEVHDGIWLAPADALAAADRGEMKVPFPTRKHLERLACRATIDEAFAHARARTVLPVAPVERADGTYDLGEESW